MLGALSDGHGVVRGLLRSADVHSTMGVLRALGVIIEDNGDEVVVHGRGIRGLVAPDGVLECGNSGTTTRLMAGVLAAHPFVSTFTGDASLSRRPMKRVADPLTAMGATFAFEHGDGLPMTIGGRSLSSIGWDSPSASAQVKSAILLAGLVAQVPVSVTEPSRSRDHTERMLSGRGVDVVVDGLTVSLGVARMLPAMDVDVPGDPSSAAFFVALAALVPGSRIELPHVCLNPTRTGFLALVQRMGATIARDDVVVQGGEIVGRITAGGATHLRSVTVSGDEIPSLIDELPMVACLAARADGETVIRGASELRVKESDRIAAVVANLRAIGADAEELPDGMIVRGSDAPLRGTVDPRGDHRLAMAFGVLGAVPGNEITVLDRACADVSYPQFWTDLARVTS
jgi:3-phosphoshikimate 1-carboxyvinyltransferase